jgi:hypothetical protein
MRQRLFIAAAALLIVMPLGAQAPAGWKMRVDASTSATDPDAPGDIKFVTMGSGFHATNPKAAVYWNPANTATGAYTVKATFRQVKASSHNNYYGIVFGGGDLDGANQHYIYFMIGQDGSWMVKHRANDAGVHTVTPRTPNDAIRKIDANGTATNALEVRVSADKIDYVVNGTVVGSTPKTGMTSRTDGVWGLRVNHMLEVHIDGVGKS